MSSLLNADRLINALSPQWEMGAYEALWDRAKASFKQLAEVFRGNPGALPSDFVDPVEIRRYVDTVLEVFSAAGIERFGVRVNGSFEYPERLRDAVYPVELFYYRGLWELINATRTIAVVGTRNPSDEGRQRTRKLVSGLVGHGVTIVSGLARGIDTAAHMAAIEAGGSTIGVIGTPISDNYPAENRDLQETIAHQHLLISQVPVCRYRRQNPWANRLFFPERNVTMSALSDATIIVEAGETSGTLIQARAALAQKRKLFILDSCFENAGLTWPRRMEARGAIRVKEIDDVLKHLEYQ
jgi:Predicted Rossmann fold nucleotide-binding protein involved in DNA uptake